MNLSESIVPFVGFHCWWFAKHRKREDYFAVIHFSISNEYKKKLYHSTTIAFGIMGFVWEFGIEIDENVDDLFY